MKKIVTRVAAAPFTSPTALYLAGHELALVVDAVEVVTSLDSYELDDASVTPAAWALLSCTVVAFATAEVRS